MNNSNLLIGPRSSNTFKETELSLWSQAALGSNTSSTHLPASFALILYNLPLFSESQQTHLEQRNINSTFLMGGFGV